MSHAEFEHLKREAHTSKDPQDLRRLAIMAQRQGLDVSGQPLPKHVVASFQGTGLLCPYGLANTAFSHTGRYFAGALRTQGLSVWDISEEKLIWHSPHLIRGKVAFDRQDRLFFQQESPHDWGFFGLDLKSTRLFKPFEDHQHSLRYHKALALSQTAHLLAFAQIDNVVTIFNLDDFSFHSQLPLEHPCVSMRFSPCGSKLILSNSQQQLVIVDIQNRSLQTISLKLKQLGACWSLSPDGDVFVSTNGDLQKIKLESLDTEPVASAPQFQCEQSTALKFSSDNEYLALIHRRQLRCWHRPTKQWLWKDPKPDLNSFHAHPKNPVFISHSNSQQHLHIRRFDTGEHCFANTWKSIEVDQIHWLAEPPVLICSRRKKGFVIISRDEHSVQQIDDLSYLDISDDGQRLIVSKGAEFLEIKRDPCQQIQSLMRSRTAQTVSFAKYTKNGIVVADIGNEQGISDIQLSRLNAPEWPAIPQLPTWNGSDIAFSPNRKFVITVKHPDLYVVWDLELWEPVQEFKSDLTSLRFANDSNTLWLSRWDSKNASIERISLDKVEDRRPPFRIGERVSIFAHNPRPDMTAWVSRQCDITLRDSQLRERFRFRGHKFPITALHFSPQGDELASADISGTIHIWKIPDA